MIRDVVVRTRTVGLAYKELERWGRVILTLEMH